MRKAPKLLDIFVQTENRAGEELEEAILVAVVRGHTCLVVNSKGNLSHDIKTIRTILKKGPVEMLEDILTDYEVGERFDGFFIGCVQTEPYAVDGRVYSHGWKLLPLGTPEYKPYASASSADEFKEASGKVFA